MQKEASLGAAAVSLRPESSLTKEPAEARFLFNTQQERNMERSQIMAMLNAAEQKRLGQARGVGEREAMPATTAYRGDEEQFVRLEAALAHIDMATRLAAGELTQSQIDLEAIASWWSDPDQKPADEKGVAMGSWADYNFVVESLMDQAQLAVGFLKAMQTNSGVCPNCRRSLWGVGGTVFQIPQGLCPDCQSMAANVTTRGMMMSQPTADRQLTVADFENNTAVFNLILRASGSKSVARLHEAVKAAGDVENFVKHARGIGNKRHLLAIRCIEHLLGEA